MKKLLLSFSLIAFTSTINAQWTSQETGFAAQYRGLSQIKIIDANTVWALAYDGSGAAANVQEFTKTTNGGTTWTAGTIDVFDPTLAINNISPVSDMIAWASAINNTTGDPNNGVGTIVKTIDGGTNWIQQLATGYQTAGSSFLNGVYFFDANVGIAYGDPESSEFEIYRTTDGGANWTRVPAAALPNPLSNEYGYNSTPLAVGSTLWFPTNKGRLYRTTDMGLTWSVFQAPLSDFGAALPANSGTLSFSTTSTGCLLKTSGTVAVPVYTFYTTTNGGQTWSAGSAFTGTRRLLSYIPGTTTIVATSAAAPLGTSISVDNGTSWTDLEPGGTTQRGVGAYLSTSIGWCAGYSDGDPLGTMGIYKLSGSLGNQSFATTKFSVYPNPATSNVTISTTGVDAYQLAVTDLLGKVIMTKSLSGIENTVDISGLTAGVYLFTLSSENKTQTVKILKN